MGRDWDGEGGGGAYDDLAPPQAREAPARSDDDCPFCGGWVEHGEVVWPNRYMLMWQEAGTRSGAGRELLTRRGSFRAWWASAARRTGHRCRSCRRVWFELQATDG